jgi:hypothetical protein
MEANIPCPHCHKSFSAQFEEIGPGKAHACPNCGATIKFEGQDLRKVQQSIDQLTKELGDAQVKVNFKVHEPRPRWKFWKR